MVKKLNISSQKNNQNVIESLKHTLHKKKTHEHIKWILIEVIMKHTIIF